MYSHFGTEDGGKCTTIWHVMLYYFKNGKNTTEMQKKNCAVYGKSAGTDQTCQKQFAKFPNTIDILAK